MEKAKQIIKLSYFIHKPSSSSKKEEKMATTKIFKWMESKWIKDKTTNLKRIGNGSYGVVFSFLEKKTNIKKALKVIDFETFERDLLRQGIFIDENTWFNEARSDIDNISYLNNGRFILCLEDHYFDKQFKCIYLVTELAKTNLLQHLKDNNYDLQALEIKRIINSVLRGLEFAHENKIVHRNIKPENILLNKAGLYVIGDWGVVGKLRELVTRKLNTDFVGEEEFFPPEFHTFESKNDKRNLFKSDTYSAGLLFLVGCGLPQPMLRSIDKFSEVEHKKKISKFLEELVRPKIPEIEELITNLTQYDQKVRFSVDQALNWCEDSNLFSQLTPEEKYSYKKKVKPV